MEYKPFRHLENNVFIVDPTFEQLISRLEISEWSAVVWLGRLFSMDEDFGEHWFDNWDARAASNGLVQKYGLTDYEELLIIDPQRFVGGKDGPCHSNAQLTRFWTDVLKSLTISEETIFAEALEHAQNVDKYEPTEPTATERVMSEIAKIKSSRT